MTRFSSIAHTPDGRAYVKHIDAPAFELHLAVKVGIGAGLVALSYYVREYTVIMLVLSLMGIVVLIATCISTYLLLTRDVDAYRMRTTPMSLTPYTIEESVAPRTITLNQHGVRSEMTIDPVDDELTKLIVKMLDASIMLTSGDVTTFPAYRALNMRYVDYDRALRGLGSLVKRERGASPIVVHPHTLQTVRTMLTKGNVLPYRADMPRSSNRLI